MKRNLLKVLGISFLIFVVLSWIIPVGSYYNGTLTTDGIDPVGLVDLFTEPVSGFITFVLYGVIFAVIGGFYGVLDKTGALDRLVDKAKKIFNGKEKLFLILTVIHFVLLSSITGLIIPLFILVPLYAAILFKMNYDKITVLASTVGGLLVGSIASTYGFNITGYTKNILSLDMSNQIVAKIILLVILTTALIIVILLASKKNRLASATASVQADVKEAALPAETKEVKEDAVKKTTTKKTSTKTSSSKTTSSKTASKSTGTKKTTAKTGTKTSTKGASKGTTKKTTTKKTNTKALAVTGSVKKVVDRSRVSIIPLVVILTLMLITALIGMYNWYYSFEITFFDDLYTNIMAVEIGDFPIFEYLFAGSTQFGYWSNIDLAAILIFAAALLAWIYRLSLNEFVESFIAGVKKWMPTAIYAALASIILAIVYSAMASGTGTFVDTINAKIFELSDGFNVIFTGVATLIGSFFYNYLYYLLADLSSFVSGFSAGDLSIAGLLIQAVYGIGMLIFPTSVVLIAGLSLFDVSYKSWMKYIWKFALIAFLLVLLVCGILTLM